MTIWMKKFDEVKLKRLIRVSKNVSTSVKMKFLLLLNVLIQDGEY